MSKKFLFAFMATLSMTSSLALASKTIPLAFDLENASYDHTLKIFVAAGGKEKLNADDFQSFINLNPSLVNRVRFYYLNAAQALEETFNKEVNTLNNEGFENKLAVQLVLMSPNEELKARMAEAEFWARLVDIGEEDFNAFDTFAQSAVIKTQDYRVPPKGSQNKEKYIKSLLEELTGFTHEAVLNKAYDPKIWETKFDYPKLTENDGEIGFSPGKNVSLDKETGEKIKKFMAFRKYFNSYGEPVKDASDKLDLLRTFFINYLAQFISEGLNQDDSHGKRLERASDPYFPKNTDQFNASGVELANETLEYLLNFRGWDKYFKEERIKKDKEFLLSFEFDPSSKTWVKKQ